MELSDLDGARRVYLSQTSTALLAGLHQACTVVMLALMFAMILCCGFYYLTPALCAIPIMLLLVFCIYTCYVSLFNLTFQLALAASAVESRSSKGRGLAVVKLSVTTGTLCQSVETQQISHD